ncbi:hypothetical protein P7H12_03895 [Paenibacillus larvae]|nr:hypothetical protein [Paenibacillus larvae]MDT2262960.1 hypothetical protein [Paenibacillus larvae]
MRAENEYLKALGATKEGKKNVSKIAQYAVVDQLSFKGYSISMLCEIAHVSRSGFYKWQRRRGTSSCKNNWRINS